MKLVRVLPLAVLVLLGGCGGQRRAVRSAAAVPADWHILASTTDRARMRSWRSDWVAALAQADRGDAAAVRGQGVLLDPDAALEGAAPPPGPYRCRMIKLGAQAADQPGFTAYPFFSCRIADSGGLLALAKLDGSQRPVGRLYPDGPSRMIFLGTMMLGDEARPLDYGRDDDRDMIGAFERIGARRWRLVLPAPRWESLLDVMELVPAEG